MRKMGLIFIIVVAVVLQNRGLFAANFFYDNPVFGSIENLRIVDTASYNLYNIGGFPSSIDRALGYTFLSAGFMNNSILLDSIEMTNRRLPSLMFMLHSEDRFDLAIGYSSKNEVIEIPGRLSSEAIIHNPWILYSGGSPEYKVGFKGDFNIASAQFVHSDTARNHPRDLLGAAEFTISTSIYPRHNLGFGFDISFNVAGDSIVKRDNGQLVTDGSVKADFVPDIKFGFNYLGNAIRQVAYFGWNDRHRIANSNFYNTPVGGASYLQRGFGMPKLYSNNIEFRNMGVFHIDRLSGNEMLSINASYTIGYRKSSVRFYEPTEDNNFPTTHGARRVGYDYELSVIPFGFGLKYMHNYFDIATAFGMRLVSLRTGDAFTSGNFAEDLVRAGDADGYELPANDIFAGGVIADRDEREFDFDILATLNGAQVTQNNDFPFNIHLGYGVARYALNRSFKGGDFLLYNKPTDFGERVLDVGIVYPTFQAELNYIPVGGFNAITERMFIENLGVNRFYSGLNIKLVETVSADFIIVHNRYSFRESGRNFTGNDLLLTIKYLF